MRLHAFGVLLALLVPTLVGAWPGDLDPTFGVDGKVVTSISVADQVHGALRQPDGKLVLAGSTDAGSGASFALLRYADDGTLDPTFGTGGIVTTSIGADAHGLALARQANGMLVVAGETGNASAPAQGFALARYQTDGTLDPAFGTRGIVVTSLGSSDAARAVAIQSDGSIVAAGFADGNFALARYDSTGTLDPTFGTGGLVTTDLGTNFDAIHAMAVQPDGKIVVAGSAGGLFALARYDTDGTLDATFGTGGTVTTTVGTPNNEGADAMALLPDGRILVGGSTNLSSIFSIFALARYATDGSLDGTFGNGGVVLTPLEPNTFSPFVTAVEALAVLPDGKILALGSARLGVGASFALVRYESDGSIDGGFSACGATTTDFRQDGTALAAALIVDPDGSLVAAGSASGFALARYVGVGGPTACEPAASRKSTINVRAIAPGRRGTSVLTWQWTSAGAVALADFGDPTTHTDLTMCVLSGATPDVFRASVTAASNCGGTACWRQRVSGYERLALSPVGFKRLAISTLRNGQAKITAKAPAVGDTLPGLTAPVIVRLRRSDGSQCWEATFFAPYVSTPLVFRGRSD